MYYHRSYSKNAEVNKKMNLFLNYFRFVADYIGLLDDLPLENHPSLVEKITFQIEHNFENCVPYVDNYLNSPLLENNPFVTSFGTYQTLKPLVDYYKQLSGKGKIRRKKNFIEWTPGFKVAFENFREELSDNAFQCSLDEVIKATCDATPADHFIDKIAYHVRLLVSEFLFSGRSKDDTIRVLDSITEFEHFPYPPGIAIKERYKYFTSLPVEDHLRAIYQLYKKEPYCHTFVCKIYNVGNEPSFELTNNKVTFRSKEKSDTILNDEDDYGKDKITDFLNDEKPFLLAYLPITYYSFYYGEMAMKNAMNAVRRAVSFINDNLNVNGVVDTREYLVLDQEGKPQRSGTSALRKIDADGITHLEGSNAAVFLAERSNEAKTHILNHEPYLFDATLSGRVTDYWHYLETIISNALPGEKQVKDICSSILLVNHWSHQSNRTEEYAKEILRSHVYWDDLGLTREEWVTLCQKEELLIDELLAKIDSPFIDEIADRYIRNYASVNYQALEKYYISILTEAYEQRNAFQHAGHECSKAVTKLSYTLPRLVTRFRWLILERADVPEEITFAEILYQLKAEGDQL